MWKSRLESKGIPWRPERTVQRDKRTRERLFPEVSAHLWCPERGFSQATHDTMGDKAGDLRPLPKARNLKGQHSGRNTPRKRMLGMWLFGPWKFPNHKTTLSKVCGLKSHYVSDPKDFLLNLVYSDSNLFMFLVQDWIKQILTINPGLNRPLQRERWGTHNEIPPGSLVPGVTNAFREAPLQYQLHQLSHPGSQTWEPSVSRVPYRNFYCSGQPVSP